MTTNGDIFYIVTRNDDGNQVITYPSRIFEALYANQNLEDLEELAYSIIAQNATPEDMGAIYELFDEAFDNLLKSELLLFVEPMVSGYLTTKDVLNPIYDKNLTTISALRKNILRLNDLAKDLQMAKAISIKAYTIIEFMTTLRLIKVLT